MDSYEWLFVEDLTRIDNRIRAIFREARTFGISEEKAYDYVRERLHQIAEKVKQKQDERVMQEAVGA